MSRSRRHSPFMGVTTAKTEKQDKRLARKRVRAREKLEQRLVDKREVSNVWLFAKDGRQMIEDKTLMRK